MIRVPGKDTSLLEIDRGAERVANERAAAIGVAPAVAVALDDPPAIVTVFVEGRGWSRRAARAGHDDQRRALAARDPRPRRAAAHQLRLVPDRRDLRRHGARARREIPTPTRGHEQARGSRRRSPGPSTSPCPATTTCSPRTSSAARTSSGRRLEYAGMGDRYFDLANFAVNNELGRRPSWRCSRPTSPSSATTRRIATLRLMKFMSDFREAMWASSRPRSPSSISTSTATPPSTSTACSRPGPPRLRDLALGSA